jgi:hypothetical protein
MQEGGFTESPQIRQAAEQREGMYPARNKGGIFCCVSNKCLIQTFARLLFREALYDCDRLISRRRGEWRMDSERFIHLRDSIGYDNERLAKMLGIEVAEVKDLCLGRKPIPATLADQLELFADWSSEVGDTTVKKDLARKHLSAC